MKKYRLKEEVKKYIDSNYNDETMTLTEWFNYCKVNEEALEEVPQRVELRIGLSDKGALFKSSEPFDKWTNQEKDLCEKALNGELLDIDSIYNYDFDDFAAEYNERNGFDGVSLRLDCYDITELLKQYLKDKQNG
jgi:hypothetical protein